MFYNFLFGEASVYRDQFRENLVHEAVVSHLIFRMTNEAVAKVCYGEVRNNVVVDGTAEKCDINDAAGGWR